MDHLDHLIPLAILVAIGVFVLILLRREAREKETTPQAAGPLPAIPFAPPTLVALQVPATTIKRKKPKRKRVSAVVVWANPAQTPIHTVLGLLQDKDSVAAAFLLREILAPPVSQRR